MLICFAGRV